MQIRNLLLLVLLFCVACKNENHKTAVSLEEKFDRIKWAIKKEEDYPYRERMLKDLVYNVPLKGLKSNAVLHLLGEPSRRDSGYLFYTVVKKYFPNTSWPMSTKTLVIKIAKDSTVEWRKIHG